MTDVPDHVRAAIERAKAGLEVRLLDIWHRRLAFELRAKGDGEGGILRGIKWEIEEREQMPAPPRTMKVV